MLAAEGLTLHRRRPSSDRLSGTYYVSNQRGNYLVSSEALDELDDVEKWLTWWLSPELDWHWWWLPPKEVEGPTSAGSEQ